jgi:hypothetical protein
MSAARHSSITIDRAYDLRVLAAIPPTLGLFAPGALEAQLRQMMTERRALCFTIMSPVCKRAPHGETADRAIATILVCLHVAPELASHGAAALNHIMTRTAESRVEPVHELAAPLDRAGFYREAVYTDSDVSVALTTHAPVELPAETHAAVAVATQGASVDVVTTIAVTPWRPQLAAKLQAERAARSTLH